MGEEKMETFVDEEKAVNDKGVSNKKIYELLIEQKELQHQVFTMKRILIVLLVFVVILALSNLGTGYAAAVLAKDIASSDGTITDKDSGEVLATASYINKYSADISGATPASGRRVQEFSASATVSGISKGAASELFDSCSGPTFIDRAFPNGGVHRLQVCPSSNHYVSANTDSPTYSFTVPDGANLVIACPTGDDSVTCKLSGSALLLPFLSECTSNSDCASNSCILSACAVPAEEGTSYYYQQDAPSGGNGLSPSSPFNTLTRNKVRNIIKPGDTIYLMGTVTNPSYNPNYSFSGDIDDPHIWNAEQSIIFTKYHGEPGKYITIRPYDENTILKGDGSNIFRVLNSSYLRIVGFNIHGEVKNIPLSTSLALQYVYRDANGVTQYRVQPGTTNEQIEATVFQSLGSGVSRPSYIDTRGFLATYSDHIVFENNHVQYVPGIGVKVFSCEYVDIIENEVDNCSRKSYSGTHAVTPEKLTDSISGDPAGVYRARILRNIVHHNYNEISSWAPSKTEIHPFIDEGKGISPQRNDFVNGGRILIASNIVYWNGFSGIHNQDCDNVDIIGNTAFMNSYTNAIYLNGVVSGNGVGISDQRGNGGVIANNIVVVDTNVRGFPISLADPNNIMVENNLVFGVGSEPLRTDRDYDAVQVNGITGDPLFVDAAGDDFSLMDGSPAIGAASPTYAQVARLDFFRQVRDLQSPTIGALVYEPAISDEE